MTLISVAIRSLSRERDDVRSHAANSRTSCKTAAAAHSWSRCTSSVVISLSLEPSLDAATCGTMSDFDTCHDVLMAKDNEMTVALSTTPSSEGECTASPQRLSSEPSSSSTESHHTQPGEQFACGGRMGIVASVGLPRSICHLLVLSCRMGRTCLTYASCVAAHQFDAATNVRFGTCTHRYQCD